MGAECPAVSSLSDPALGRMTPQHDRPSCGKVEAIDFQDAPPAANQAQSKFNRVQRRPETPSISLPLASIFGADSSLIKALRAQMVEKNFSFPFVPYEARSCFWIPKTSIPVLTP
jgi:hypothetical protein